MKAENGIVTGISGHHFGNTEIWWDYVLTLSESERLDMMLGLALIDQEFNEHIFHQSWAVLENFHFSRPVYSHLTLWKGETLEGLAKHLLNIPVTVLY